MKRRILIAINDPYQMNQIREDLEAKLNDISIDLVFDERTAMEKISRADYALVIAHQHLPQDSKTPIQEEEKRGLCLSQWIDANAHRIPTVLLTFQSDKDVMAAVYQLKNCDAVSLEIDNWQNFLMNRVQEKLTVNPVAETKRLDVDIYIDLEKNRAEADLRGIHFPFSFQRRPLQIKGSEMIKLSTSTAHEVDRTDNSEKWRKRLKKVGEALMQHIFEKNHDFYIDLVDLIRMVGGLQNTRIRFIVEEKVNAVALESIFGRHEFQRKDYWMLHAPIYRTIRDCPGFQYPLFHEEDIEMAGRPINVLIIEAPTEGIIKLEGFEKELCMLENVAKECDFLKDYFRRIQDSGRAKIGIVKRIPENDSRTPLKEQLRKTLEKEDQCWHIVHYAGHSFFEHRTQSGYVFFPGPGNTIEDVKVDLLSIWLRKANTRFVFLSSCHSSEAGFVFAMARQHIPAIVGFRWDVDDNMAFNYTQTFYQELMEGQKQSLEYAFLKARKSIYSRHESNPIWAAPVLVMQIPT